MCPRGSGWIDGEFLSARGRRGSAGDLWSLAPYCARSRNIAPGPRAPSSGTFCRVDTRSIGQLAERLVSGYMAHLCLTSLLDEPIADSILVAIDQLYPPGRTGAGHNDIVLRKDGTAHFIWVPHFLRTVSQSPEYRSTQDRAFLAGALLELGDELARVGCVDRSPDLELLRHLRNGIAHGNRFSLRHGEPLRPAHFTGAAGLLLDGVTSVASPTTFEITPAVDGQPVLFDFMGPGDICDLLLFIGWRLIRLGNGDPPHDLWPQ